jgi:integrase/recombinase XerC
MRIKGPYLYPFPRTSMANELARRKKPGTPALTSVDVLASWMEGKNQRTLEAYMFDLRDFANFIGATSESSAVEALLTAGHGGANQVTLRYRADMKDRGLSTATRARRLAALRSMVKVARLIGRVEWSIDVAAEKVVTFRDTAGPGKKGWRKLIATAIEEASTGHRKTRTPVTDRPRKNRPRPDVAKRDVALLVLMHDLGLRRGECVALDLADVRLDESKVAVIGKGRTDPELHTLPDETLAALKEWIEARGDWAGPLFPRLDSAAGDSRERLTGHAVHRLVKRLSERAGLERPTWPHGIRHQAITRVSELNDGNLLKTQEFARHGNSDTTKKYIDNQQDHRGEGARALAKDR